MKDNTEETTLVIIDADAFTHIISHNLANKKAKHFGTMAINRYVLDVMKKTNATHYVGFYDGKSEGAVPCFRNVIYPDYKANRGPSADCVKRWRPILFKTMAEKWNFVNVEGLEADDACAIAVEYYRDQFDNIALATTDKDLKQVKNINHYNYSKHLSTLTGDFAADYNFAMQMLVGDTADNIPALFGVGPKKGIKILESCKNITDLKWAVIRTYKNFQKEFIEKESIKQTKLVKKAYALKYPELSKSRLLRKIRIDIAEDVQKKADAFMPEGWKKYITLQYRLLRMLVKPIEGFLIPEPLPCPYVKKKPVADKAVSDDFLYED